MRNNVFALRSGSNAVVIKKQRNLNLLNQALEKDKSQTNLDFSKIAVGDQTENQRLKMRQYQEKMNSR